MRRDLYIESEQSPWYNGDGEFHFTNSYRNIQDYNGNESYWLGIAIPPDFLNTWKMEYINENGEEWYTINCLEKGKETPFQWVCSPRNRQAGVETYFIVGQKITNPSVDYQGTAYSFINKMNVGTVCAYAPTLTIRITGTYYDEIDFPIGGLNERVQSETYGGGDYISFLEELNSDQDRTFTINSLWGYIDLTYKRSDLLSGAKEFEYTQNNITLRGWIYYDSIRIITLPDNTTPFNNNQSGDYSCVYPLIKSGNYYICSNTFDNYIRVRWEDLSQPTIRHGTDWYIDEDYFGGFNGIYVKKGENLYSIEGTSQKFDNCIGYNSWGYYHDIDFYEIISGNEIINFCNMFPRLNNAGAPIFGPNYQATGEYSDNPEDLQEWQLDTSKNFYNGIISGNSPLEMNLWSIKETKNNKIVVDTFPYYNKDAGEGTFFSLIRTKLNSGHIERDENGNIILRNVGFTFEDAVRKSAWEQDTNIMHYFLNNINTGDFSNNFSQNKNYISGAALFEDNTMGQGQIVNFDENNKLKVGFYKGQLASYYCESLNGFIIKIKFSWNNYLSLEQQISFKIKLNYFDENGYEQVIEKVYQDVLIGEIKQDEFEVQSIDENGNPIEYTIQEEFINDNNWNIIFSNQKIKYGDKTTVCSINNIRTQMDYKNEDIDVLMTGQSYSFIENDFYLIENFIEDINGEKLFNYWKEQVHELKKMIEYNQSKIFYCIYKWYTFNEKNEQVLQLMLIPYVSLIEKRADGTFYIHHYRINTIPINPNDPLRDPNNNPLYTDMFIDPRESNLVVPSANIRCPYICFLNNGEYYIGFNTYTQFYKKGCVAKGVAAAPEDVEYWKNEYDKNYINSTVYQLFYAGSPTDSMLYENYNRICPDFVFTNTGLKFENNQLKLKNFCLYIIDLLCLDTDNVEDAIPYFYKIKIQTQATNSEDGILYAQLTFNNEKSNDFKIVPSADGADPNLDSDYSKHLLNNYNTDNFIDGSNVKEITADKQKIIDAYELKTEIQDFLSEYYTAY